MNQQQASTLVSQIENEIGLTPGLLDSVWDQESKKSLDLGLKGIDLSRNRGNATGPFQIVPYYHPDADLSSFESQARYAGNLLDRVGVRGYYGEGNVPEGFPSTDDYEKQVMARLQDQGGAETSPYVEPGGQVVQQQVQQQGLLTPPQAPQQQGLLAGGGASGDAMPAWRRPGFWGTVAGNIDPYSPSIGSIGKGLAAANKQAFEQDLKTSQLNNMTPFQKASIQLQQQQQLQKQQMMAQKQQQTNAARQLAASKVTDPATKQLILLGGADNQLGNIIGGTSTKNTPQMRNYEFLKERVGPERAFQIAFRDMGAAGGPGTTKYGTVASGYKREFDEAGNPVDTPISGSKPAKEREQAQRQRKSALQAIDDLQALVVKHGEGMDLFGKAGVEKEMAALHDEILTQVGALGNAGVLQVGDLERFKKSIVNPTDRLTPRVGKEDIRQGLDAIRTRITRNSDPAYFDDDDLTGYDDTPSATGAATHRYNPVTGKTEAIQ